MHYPIKKKILDLIKAKNESVKWLASEIKVSTKSIYNFENIGNISLEDILALSKALEFNFLEDYNNWLRENHEPALGHWNEEEIVYNRETKDLMTLTFSLRGNQQTMGVQFGNVLKALKKECDTYGLEIV